MIATALAALALAVPLQGRVVQDSFPSAAGRLSFDVYLPPGYDGSTTRYPVVYYLHGLPAGPDAYKTFGYVPRALEAAGERAIVVAPQGARTGDTDPEYVDWGPGRDWGQAIAVQLPHVVDARYRTIAARSARALVGLSAGGYGAMLLGLHHLGLFSVIESWSGYFHPTDPSGTRSIDDSPWWSAHAFVGSLRRAFAVHPTFLGFYVGAGDVRFRAENVELARELSRARVPFLFRLYPGGHEQSLWSAQAQPWLTLALARLTPPR